MGAPKLPAVQDLEWATSTNRWSLKVCGIWRGENDSRCHDAFSNLIVPFYAFFIAMFGLIPQTLALVKVWGDLTLMVDNLISSVPLAVTLCKIVTLWFKKEAVITMMNFIKDDWAKLSDEREREVMIKYAQISRLLTIGGYVVIATSVIVYHPPVIFGIVLRTVTNLTDTGHRPLVLQAVYLIDVYETPIYQLTAISQVMTCSLAGFCYSTFGALFGVVVLHVCSQLENLKISIERMAKSAEESSTNFQNDLTFNVQEHQRLIRFVEMIENTFSKTLIVIVPAFTITFCVQGFQLIIAFGEDVGVPIIQVVFCLIYMSWIAFVMFVYSAVGQVLVTQSEELQYAAYNCEWYNLKPQEAAQLIVILLRAQRPLTITAGKFMPLSLSTFSALLRTTSGYLSCLLAVQE